MRTTETSLNVLSTTFKLKLLAWSGIILTVVAVLCVAADKFRSYTQRNAAEHAYISDTYTDLVYMAWFPTWLERPADVGNFISSVVTLDLVGMMLTIVLIVLLAYGIVELRRSRRRP